MNRTQLQQSSVGSDASLHYLGLIEVGKLVQAGHISSAEVTQAELDRIGALDGELKSYACVMEEQALAQAAAADREIAAGRKRGPLHGVPIAVKDLCWTEDAPTAAGMALYRNFRPKEDATVVRRLKDAGAVILGKLQLTESAFSHFHPDIAPPRNPWDAELWSGVSSSGSGVATAAGLCYGSLGSDTGGSIRFPSAANSITGLKPTWGRVSRYGVFELAATLDHIGPMARSAADCGAMLGAIAGIDTKDPTSVPEQVPDYLAGLDGSLRGLRIGIDRRWTSDGVDGETVTAVNDTLAVLELLGGDVREITFPDVAATVESWVPLCAIEAAVAHEVTYPSRKDAYGPILASVLDLGRSLSAMDYQKIVLSREDLRGRVRALFSDVDLMVVPVQPLSGPTAIMAVSLGEDTRRAMLRFTSPFNMTGSPTITLPAGFTAAGAPVGIQFVSRHFDEALLVRAGDAFQRMTDWHRRHPVF